MTSDTSKFSITKGSLYLFLILVLSFLVYNPLQKAKFTNWDDDIYITKNKDITSFKKYKLNLLSKTYACNYHPLTMLSYAYDYSIGKYNPKIYHRTNILIHLINAVLVFYFIFLITQNEDISFICGLLFGIHPIHVESVAWISERKNVLYTLFFLASLIAYIYYIKKNKWEFYFLAFFMFLFSLFSKGTAVSLSVALVALDYLFERNIIGKKVLLEKIPFFILSIIFGMVAIFSQPMGKEIDPGRAAPQQNPFYEKILYSIYNIGSYIFNILLPIKLAIFYPYPEKENGILPFQYYLLPIVIIAIFAFFIIHLLKNKTRYSKLLLFGLVFFIINIVLVLQLFPVGDAIRADRYTYIPSIGIFLCIGTFYQYIKSNKITNSLIIVSIITAYCLFLSYLTYDRSKIWRDSISLWSDEIKKYPNLAMAYNNRGIARHDINDLSGAMSDYKKCIKLNPLFYRAYNNIGIIESINNQKESIDYFNKAISINKGYADAYLNRARIKYQLKDYESAIKDCSAYINLDPSNHNIFLTRAMANFHLKKYSNAIEDFSKVIQRVPDHAEAYSNRGVAKSMINDYSGAIHDFDRAIEINPYYGDAYYNRAKTKSSMNLTREACEDIQLAAQYGHPRASRESDLFCK